MKYITLLISMIIYSATLSAQDCASVKEKLLQIARLKIAYEKTLDRDMVEFFKREDKNYDPDIEKARARYIEEISKIGSDTSAKMCIEMMIAKNDTTSGRSFIQYRYVNPLLSTIPHGSYLTYLDYLKAVHYSIYVANEDRLLLSQRIPALSYLFNNNASLKY